MVDYNKLIDEKLNLELEIARSIRISIGNFYNRLILADVDISHVEVSLLGKQSYHDTNIALTVTVGDITIT